MGDIMASNGGSPPPMPEPRGGNPSASVGVDISSEAKRKGKVYRQIGKCILCGAFAPIDQLETVQYNDPNERIADPNKIVYLWAHKGDCPSA